MLRFPVALVAALIATLMVATSVMAQTLPPLPGADGITFASLATTTGAVVAAGIIFGTIQVLKGAFPNFVSRITGAGLAFVLSAILYVITAIVLAPGNADGYLVIFIAWLNCALAAVGIHATTSTMAVRAGVAALKDPGVAEKAVEKVGLTLQPVAPAPDDAEPDEPLLSVRTVSRSRDDATF